MAISKGMMSAAALILLEAGPVEGANLDVTVEGVRNDAGNIRLALFDSPDAFLDGAALRQQIKAKAGSPTAVFPELEAGTYALAVIHDENSNGELDTTLFGIPTEGFGFSNDARGFMGPPDFEDAAIEIGDRDQAISVSISYLVEKP